MGGNIVATNKASIQAKGDISIVAGKDSILHKEKHSKSSEHRRTNKSQWKYYTSRSKGY